MVWGTNPADGGAVATGSVRASGVGFSALEPIVSACGWGVKLKGKTGLDTAVANFVRRSPGYDDFVTKLVGVGERSSKSKGEAVQPVEVQCSKGRHRSVCAAEDAATQLRC